jgi:hypothetical protein
MSTKSREEWEAEFAAAPRAPAPKPAPAPARATVPEQKQRATLRLEASAEELKAAYPKEAKALRDAIARCHQPKNPDYKYYGARGIRVYKDWRKPHGLIFFMRDVGPAPETGAVLGRRNSWGNFTPCNTCWLSKHEVLQNKRSSLLLTLNGETQCLAEWGRRSGHSYPQLVPNRIQDGWNPIVAALAPQGRRKLYAHQFLDLPPLLPPELAASRPKKVCAECGTEKTQDRLYQDQHGTWRCAFNPCRRKGSHGTDEET